MIFVYIPKFDKLLKYESKVLKFPLIFSLILKHTFNIFKSIIFVFFIYLTFKFESKFPIFSNLTFLYYSLKTTLLGFFKIKSIMGAICSLF